MNNKLIKLIISLFIAASFIVGAAGSVYGETYDALKGVDSIRAIVDFRVASAKVAAIHLDLLHKTYKDKSLTAVDANPDFVIVFMGPGVKLISTNRQGVSAEDSKHLDTIAGIIKNMKKDGIKLEVCIAAVELLGVDKATILPEITKVQNGWISSIGYQHRGYALIPDF